MIGYHITSYENWEKIKVEGLIPYDVYQKTYKEILKDKKVVMVWRNRPDGLDLLGSILDRVCQKHSYHIVLIKVRYSILDEFRSKESIRFLHEGGLTHEHNKTVWVYHKNKELRMLINTIPSSQLTLLKDWNLLKMVNSE